jgi:hypothetical protein
MEMYGNDFIRSSSHTLIFLCPSTLIFPTKADTNGGHDSRRRVRTASFFGFNQQMTMFCLSSLEAELQKRGLGKMLQSELHAVKNMLQSMCKEQQRQNGGKKSPFCQMLPTEEPVVVRRIIITTRPLWVMASSMPALPDFHLATLIREGECPARSSHSSGHCLVHHGSSSARD